jgi:hypothetical protein
MSHRLRMGKRVNSISLCILSSALVLSCSFHDDKGDSDIRGIYGSPVPFWDRGLELKDLGVNAIFLHSGSFSQKIVERAKREGIKVFAEFAILNGKGYVDQHPEAWAINERGERVKAASWFMGVCPTDEGFKQFRLQQLRELVRQYDVHGVWMDYVHWHAQFEEESPILPETCFCNRCLATFQDATHIHIPYGTIAEKSTWVFENHDPEWRDWRCSVIAGWAKDVKSILLVEKPGALLGMFHCPWNDEEFSGARRRILGIDYEMLKGTIDVFSPMVYHRRMGRSPEWVKENLAWFYKRINVRSRDYPRVWPIVQAHNDPVPISSAEFETVLVYGLSAEATGVMMFTGNSVAEDPAKTEVMKKVYRSL